MSRFHVASVPVPYTHSLRVTLFLKDGNLRVLQVVRVAMRAPAAPPSPPAKEQSGFWFEVRDAQGNLLYHRPLPHPVTDSIEVFDDPKGGSIRRVPAKRAEVKFDLILPDLPQATEFTFYGAGRDVDLRKPSTVLERRSMDSLREGAQSKSGRPRPDSK